MIRASVVLPAAAVTRYSNEPDSLIVPANTGSPSTLSTGRLSPVIGAWLIEERPLTTSPSSPMRSPGFTRTVAPILTSLTPICCHESSGCCTVTVSGVSCSSPFIALRARSSDFTSISSAIVNSTMTIAASGHWPMMSAPVTAMLINALMFRLPLLMAIQPFLYVLEPQAKTARMASAAANQPGYPSQPTASDAIADTPAAARGHHGFSGFLAAPNSPLASTSSPSKFSERRTSRTVTNPLGACTTVSTLCIRSNSNDVTDDTPSKALRINASSVGQSIWMIRMAVRMSSPAIVACGSESVDADASAQQFALCLSRVSSLQSAMAKLLICPYPAYSTP